MIKYIFSFILVLALVVASWLTPWSRPRGTITVTGQSRDQVANQLARFNVNVSQTNDDKSAAVEAVNSAMAEINKAVKEFGIEEKDLTTQNVSVYETEKQDILIYPPRPEYNPEAELWQASNSLEIILRDVSRASALTDLLQQFPLAEVFGPSFSIDDTAQSGTDLLVQAVDDARDKAEKLAEAAGQKIGKVITVSETGGVYPLYRGLEMAAVKDAVPAPVEPGSTEMTKTVTVVFELR